MHASTEQLLSLRDGAPVVSEVTRHVASCDHCSGELDRLRLVRRALQSLPPVPAPASAWKQLSAGLDTPRLRKRHWAALAATVAVAAVVAWAVLPRTAHETDPGLARVTAQPDDLDSLVAESRQLEQLLRTLDRQSPHTMSAVTAGTIAGLEDSIALIDYGLTYDSQISGEASRRLWSQRVDLMNSLVQVRGAQLQRVSN